MVAESSSPLHGRHQTQDQRNPCDNAGSLGKGDSSEGLQQRRLPTGLVPNDDDRWQRDVLLLQSQPPQVVNGVEHGAHAILKGAHESHIAGKGNFGGRRREGAAAGACRGCESGTRALKL